MNWTTTDPRISGLAASVGAVVGYVSAGTLTTLAKVGSGTTDWAAIPTVMPAPPMSASRCDVATTDPRTAGRAARVDTVCLYYAAGVGTYLIKYGAGDTQWVPLPSAVTSGGGGATLPIAESDVTGLVADLAAKAALSHTHAEADVTGLVADLAAKADKTITISTTAPLSGGGDLSANRTLVVADNSTSSKGVVAQAPNDTSKFYRGDATWARLSAWAWMFGSGVDGNLHFDGASNVTLGDGTVVAVSGGNYTLPRDISGDSITIDGGVIVFAHGVRIHAKTGIFGTGTISVRGNAGGNAVNSITAGAAGVAIAARTWSGVSAGIIGSSSAPGTSSPNAPLGFVTGFTAATTVDSAGNNGAVGSGGTGGAGGRDSGGGGPPIAGGGQTGTITLMDWSVGGPVLDAPPSFWSAIGVTTVTKFTWGTSGTAGGQGNGNNPGKGGGSGTAGGACYIAALTIDSTITIDARGGAGGNGGNATSPGGIGGGGGGGGAGGGSGGVVNLLQGYGTLPTITITGGVGGTGGAGDAGGASGKTGGNGGNGLKFVYLLSA